jgi:hypothetical protein
MAVSSARLLANRRNALKSTGPKTAEGKSVSRRNSLKHGLTGDGVVVSEADASEVDRRSEALHRELKPSGEAGRILLRRFAFLSVRLEKCEHFDQTTTAHRVRHAGAAFDDERKTRVEVLATNLASDPVTVSRRLQESPEGIDWLIGHWAELREDLFVSDRKAWTLNHWTRVEQLLGHPGGNIRMTRPYALTQALSGFFVHLGTNDGAGLDDNARIEWARAELGAIIDAEVERLRGVKADLDPAAIARDRAEAPGRALFDPSPAMNLARKYEAATERAMYKALDRFHDVELAALEAEPCDATPESEDPCDRLASILPGSRDPSELAEDRVGPAPRSVYLRESEPARATHPVPLKVGRAKSGVA